MNFEEAHTAYMQRHLKARRGEARRRLEEGHGHAERCFLQQVWWPAIGSFDDLVPECEVHDFRDGTRFIDFAFIREPVRLAIEIDGYGPHVQKLSRTQFSDQLIRQNHLILDGWKVLRFSYDDVKDKPRMCEQMIQQFMGKWFGGAGSVRAGAGRFSLEEREILRLALRCNGRVKPRDVCRLLGVEQQKARRLLHGLLDKGALVSGGRGESQRLCTYYLSPHVSTDVVGL